MEWTLSLSDPRSPVHTVPGTPFFLSGTRPANPAAAASSWSQHPLSSAMLLQPSIGPLVVDRCCSELQNLRLPQQLPAAVALGPLWAALQPFFSFVLMQV